MTREQILLISIVAMIVWGVIVYNIIKSAVASANKPLEEKLQRLIELEESKL